MTFSIRQNQINGLQEPEWSEVVATNKHNEILGGEENILCLDYDGRYIIYIKPYMFLKTHSIYIYFKGVNFTTNYTPKKSL
jgi:hypothetical protein